MSDRSFGNEIGNTTTMTASGVDDDIIEIPPATKNGQAQSLMDQKAGNGKATSRLPRPLAIEVYSKVHNSSLSKDSLLDEIEDLVDEKYFAGEVLMSGGKEFTVVSSEKRGGLTTYTMEDGSKIGHRDLRRKKGLSVEEIKQIAIEDAIFEDEKTWKVKEELLAEYPIRETKKFAAIFNTPKSAKRPAPQEEGTESESEENELKLTNGDSQMTPRRGRASASGAPALRKAAEKQRLKEQKEKEKAEKKEKEKAEKLKKKEEEKAKKLEEKEKKAEGKAKKNGTMDQFVKKSDSNGAPTPFSPSKWGEKRVAAGVKKLEDAWNKREQDAFNEACAWCEKNLSGVQQRSIENQIWRFAVQKLVDKTKDKAATKGWKWAKKAEYKVEMAEKRKETYRIFEPRIKSWFMQDSSKEDLLIVSTPLEFTNAIRIECDEELLKCMEIAQFFVSMRKILLWTDDIAAEQLRDDLHQGLVGFERSTYKMIANLLETALQEKEHEKAAHCNARLSEFPITPHTISELVRAFFVGKTEMSWKNDYRRGEEEEMEEPDSEDTKKDGEDLKEEEQKEEKEAKEEEDVEDEDEEDEEDDEEEKTRLRMISLFSDNLHIYEWPAEKQLEVLYAMKGVVHGLPIIREWFLRDANSDQLMALKKKANDIGKKIEKHTLELSEMPLGEITETMSRNETREAEKIAKKRQALEKILDDLRDELEENREESARERDDLERIFRVISIGSDRHLRKYYWFAYSCDAGIWVQDFGKTSYEKWVRECAEKGASDVEMPITDVPDYVDLPLAPSESHEIWYRLSTEESIRALAAALNKNGKREKVLKKYLTNNMDDILSSIAKKGAKEEKKEAKNSEEEVSDKEMEENAPEDVTSTSQATVNTENSSENQNQATKFTGPFASLKSTMSELLFDWKHSGITKIADVAMFETRMDDAKTLEEMKPLVIELAKSIPTEVLIEKFPQNIAIAKKCFSHLKIDRFVRRIQDATNPSCLHMLLAYFDARIDSKRTLPELPCFVCRRKTHTNRKVMCKQCTTVYHTSCHKPAISMDMFEEEGFKESWWCAKCKKDERRRQLAEEKEAQAASQDAESGSSDDEEAEDTIEEEEVPRGRSAKRKANEAMRDVMEFEGTLRRDQIQAPPPPKKQRKEPLPEIREMFDSIEKANPRLYKVLQNVPAASRSTRNSHHENRSLLEIEDDLGEYKSVDLLREHLAQFFQQARGWVETHNSRKMDELDSLISQLDFV